MDVERLRLGGADYVWRAGRLQDVRGTDVPLRAKSLTMFAALLAHRGMVLSKDRLSLLVWPDAAATDESIARCIADIRKALNDERHEIVETFPKQGYRLNVQPEPAATKGVAPGRAPTILTGLLAAIAIIILAAFLLRPASDSQVSRAAAAPARTAGTTVALLPFRAETEAGRFLAAGLAEDLEIHLAEISGLRILSQDRTPVESNASPVDLARAAGTDYIVDGGLRESGNRISMSLRLIDGADGAILWADRYEGLRRGIVAFRDRIPSGLVSAMGIRLSARDRERLALRDTDDPEAFEAVLRARRALSSFTYEGSLAAERHLRQAISRDPDYARAYAELASAHVIRMENDWIVLSSADTAKAFYFAETALDLDPDLWFGHYALGRLHSVAEVGDVEIAIDHLETAMRLQPANDDARIYYAVVRMMSGDIEAAVPIFRSVMEANPEPPFWYHLGWANALFHMRRYEEALEAVSRCLRQMPNSPYCLRSQIAILARLGHIDDAEWAIEEYAVLGHDATLEAVMSAAIERVPEMKAHLRDAYILAGLR